MNRAEDRTETETKNPRGSIAGLCGAIAAASLLAIVATGCSMCCGPHDFEYPMFQSRYARVDPEYGRVGSIFSDQNVMPGPRPLTNAEVPRKEERLGMDDDDSGNDGTDDPEFRQPDPQKANPEKNPFQGQPDPADQDTQDTSVNYRNPVPPRRR